MQVDAEPCGVKGLFLNRDPKVPDRGWVITHRATGLRLSDYFFKRRKDAARVAQCLTEEHGVDWSIKDPDEFVKAHFGINKWMDNIVRRECSPGRYVLRP